MNPNFLPFSWAHARIRDRFTPCFLRYAAWVLLLTGAGWPALGHADSALAKRSNCFACHAMERKLIGPSFRDISARYAPSAQAASTLLIDRIRNGGSGTWGQIPMPANPQVSADEAQRLVDWILSIKPES